MDVEIRLERRAILEDVGRHVVPLLVALRGHGLRVRERRRDEPGEREHLLHVRHEPLDVGLGDVGVDGEVHLVQDRVTGRVHLPIDGSGMTQGMRAHHDLERPRSHTEQSEGCPGGTV